MNSFKKFLKELCKAKLKYSVQNYMKDNMGLEFDNGMEIEIGKKWLHNKGPKFLWKSAI